MKLTLALGLQYDNSQPEPKPPISMPPGNSIISAPALEPVIDVTPETNSASLDEFSSHHGVFFLTYNMQGFPDPLMNDAVKIDLFA
ncbi:hypothetical protein MMIC_P1399 [Mariprofundus micogutta]|uniref:Uncharacterized protein n=1 Tax=Mariprofundus micogutta TaxID=1921010 RepID=A0A1L8CNG4_9PROT|nr:hypothetical protein [Mariprofundus micogutta]GAV20434.1 hypothetical protein MMIC_P1399 [Mariprofundus micogutta]